MGILIKNVLLSGKKTSILVEGNKIARIGGGGGKDDEVVDASGMAAIPGLVNAHTHAAMTLFRGYADDLELYEWLSKHIWPLEAKLTEDDVYWGAKLACLEMIKSGTTAFNDMYWHPLGTARAAKEMGIRGVVSSVFIDLFDKSKVEEQIKHNEKVIPKLARDYGSRVTPALGPHAVYTVSKESLEWCVEYSHKKDIPIHFHLAETRKENEDSVKQFGKRPVPYLEELGFLSKNLIAAHNIWLTKGEIKTLAKNKVTAVYDATSNMKLATGGVMPYPQMRESGVRVALGTDGCASNNSLDMFEEMKFASLLQKAHLWDQTVMPAAETLEIATKNGAEALKIDAGVIAEGKLADIVLIDLNRPELTPHHNLASDLVYSANGSCVDTVICDGRILMRGRNVPGEEKILAKAREVARDLVKRGGKSA